MSFLALPPALRQQIYCEAGLAHGLRVNLNPPRDGPYTNVKFNDLEIFLNLLRSCRTVCADVSSFFYSKNRFFIRFGDAHSLRALRHLGADSLASLTNLTVHLNVLSSEVEALCCHVFPSGFRSPYQDDTPLRVTSRLHREILSEWQTTARVIAAHTHPLKLALNIICHVAELEAATLAIEPFQDFPALADCSIRLGRYPDRLIQDLAQDTALKAMGHDTTHVCSPFRFLDLPAELRHQILGFTDLVTPLGEVEWTPEKGFHVQRLDHKRFYEPGYPSAYHVGCRFRDCSERSRGGCFCRHYHSAFSSTCQPWVAPWPMFLVCRALREDAEAVFFTKNRFLILPFGGCEEIIRETPARLGASIFLTEVVPPEALRFLRFVEIVFAPFDGDYLRPEEPAYHKWVSTIDQVKDQLNLPLLTLRVYMADISPLSREDSKFRRNMTKQQGLAIVDTYMTTFRPLAAWKGLGRFFAHLACPFAQMLHGDQHQHGSLDLPKGGAASVELRVERMVMGEDYNADAAGKREQENSQWLLWINHHFMQMS